MTFTYSGDPATSTRDRTRLTTGDTDPNAPDLQDEEIDWLLTETGDSYLEASWRALLVAASNAARLVDTSSGDLSVSLSRRAEALREQAMEIRKLARRQSSVPVPYAGGLSRDEKVASLRDDDLILSRFWRDQFRTRELRGDDDLDRYRGRYSDGRYG